MKRASFGVEGTLLWDSTDFLEGIQAHHWNGADTKLSALALSCVFHTFHLYM